MRAWKKQSPDSYCMIHYDKLYIDNRLYTWDKELAQVRLLLYLFYLSSYSCPFSSR